MASPLTKVPEPDKASITIVKHKQSLALAHDAVDRPSSPNQVEGPDTRAMPQGHIQSLLGLPQQSWSLMRPPSLLILPLIELSRPWGLTLLLQFSRPESPPFIQVTTSLSMMRHRIQTMRF